MLHLKSSLENNVLTGVIEISSPLQRLLVDEIEDDGSGMTCSLGDVGLKDLTNGHQIGTVLVAHQS